MKATIALLAAALAMSACTRVIERPVAAPSPSVVTTERVVTVPSAASGATAGSCLWAGQSTSSGGLSCQQGSQYRCSNGTWTQTALSC
jgi:hypothetical protein